MKVPILGEGQMAPDPSTEMPNSAALNLWNSGSTSWYSAIWSVQTGLQSAG
jgi:hypothetical protein